MVTAPMTSQSRSVSICKYKATYLPGDLPDVQALIGRSLTIYKSRTLYTLIFVFHLDIGEQVLLCLFGLKNMNLRLL